MFSSTTSIAKLAPDGTQLNASRLESVLAAHCCMSMLQLFWHMLGSGLVAHNIDRLVIARVLEMRGVKVTSFELMSPIKVGIVSVEKSFGTTIH